MINRRAFIAAASVTGAIGTLASSFMASLASATEQIQNGAIDLPFNLVVHPSDNTAITFDGTPIGSARSSQIIQKSGSDPVLAMRQISTHLHGIGLRANGAAIALGKGPDGQTHPTHALVRGIDATRIRSADEISLLRAASMSFIDQNGTAIIESDEVAVPLALASGIPLIGSALTESGMVTASLTDGSLVIGGLEASSPSIKGEAILNFHEKGRIWKFLKIAGNASVANSGADKGLVFTGGKTRLDALPETRTLIETIGGRKMPGATALTLPLAAGLIAVGWSTSDASHDAGALADWMARGGSLEIRLSPTNPVPVSALLEGAGLFDRMRNAVSHLAPRLTRLGA